jgi:5'-phosphate synthase pdxT subunit
MTNKPSDSEFRLGKLKIGVLALQGSFQEHLSVLNKIGVEAAEIRLPDQLSNIHGLIIPGGESTTIGKLLVDYELLDPVRSFGAEKPIWGTCAGAILLSRDAHRNQPLLGIMNITVDRNAFGRQIASFETDLEIPALERISPGSTNFHGVFIRAPLIESISGEAEALSRLSDGRIVAAQENHLLATAFHPELTNDDRFHRYFLNLVKDNRQK